MLEVSRFKLGLESQIYYIYTHYTLAVMEIVRYRDYAYTAQIYH